MKASAFLLLTAAAAAQPVPERVEVFEKKVRRVLVTRCYACHSADTKPAGGLRVDDRNGLLRGGDSGPAVVPGDPAKSALLARVEHADPKRRMPKEGSLLTPVQIADLRTWITDGAAWPIEKVAVSASISATTYDRLRKRHWSLQPVSKQSGDIDSFIQAKLAERN